MAVGNFILNVILSKERLKTYVMEGIARVSVEMSWEVHLQDQNLFFLHLQQDSYSPKATVFSICTTWVFDWELFII